MAFLNTTVREAELVNVPVVRENGMTEVGKMLFSSGIRIRLVPPPQIVLIQKANIATKRRSVIFNSSI